MENLWFTLLETIIKIIIVMGALLTVAAIVTLAERRLSAFIQDRLGPNRVGPFGLFQPVADGLKLFFKEDFTPDQVDKPFYNLAPMMVLIPSFITVAVIPFGNTLTLYGHAFRLQIADVNIGILFIFALTSLGVYGIVLGGWSSNNKYSMFGSLRSAAQLISYELSLGLSAIGVLIITGSLKLSDVVFSQGAMIGGMIPHWNVFVQPFGFLIFLISAFAETNRLPFDLPEAEQELVGGYHTEYSSMKFASFYLAEYCNVVVSSALIVTLFFGGWQIPYIEHLKLSQVVIEILQIVSFSIKTSFFILLFIWVRWSLPRFKYNQLMDIGWKVLLPLALINIVITVTVMAF